MRKLFLFVALTTLVATPLPGQQSPSTAGAQPATMTVVVSPNGVILATPGAPPAGDSPVKSLVTISQSTVIVVKDGTLVPVQVTMPANTVVVPSPEQPAAQTKIEKNADGSTTETILDRNGNPVASVRRTAAAPAPPK